MASIFLVATTGFSYVKHYCNTSKTEHLQFFTDNYKCKTEIETPKNCCCSKHASSCKNNSKIHYKTSECCNNTYQYLKIAHPFNLRLSIVKLVVDLCPFITSINNSLNNTNDLEVAHHLYQPPPLLLFGKYLIHFIHNIKIPFSSY